MFWSKCTTPKETYEDINAKYGCSGCNSSSLLPCLCRGTLPDDTKCWHLVESWLAANAVVNILFSFTDF